ncbi:MAG: type II secretion system major pseudopilin GspG [Nitrospirota bacterium]
MSLWIYKKGKDGKKNVYWVSNPGLLIMVLLGLLAALAAPRMFSKAGKARQMATYAQIEIFASALENFKKDIGRYPANPEGLNVLINHTDIEGWNGPYLKKQTIPKDPWGRFYNYTSPGTHGSYDLWSYGADGLPDGEGENKDILSWEYEKKGLKE